MNSVELSESSEKRAVVWGLMECEDDKVILSLE